VKQIAPEMLRLIAETHGYASLEWTRSVPIPDDDDFPVLQVPEEKLEYSMARGYPISFEPRRVGDRFLLFVQIESFEIAGHETAAWAVPTKYTPDTDEERIANELGFDEGWDDARMECIFVCDQRFSVFWRAAYKRERFGLTVFGTESLYPVTLGKRELGPLSKILSKGSN
jgi:hypothetical protein